MNHLFTFFLSGCILLSACTQLQNSTWLEEENPIIGNSTLVSNIPVDSSGTHEAIRSYDYGVLPLTPHSPENRYMPVGREVSVNCIGKEGGVIEVTAGYPDDGYSMKDSFQTSFGDSYLLPDDHFSVRRDAIDSSHVKYIVRASKNESGKPLVFFIEIFDLGTSTEGRSYFNKAWIIIEQAQ